MKHTNLVIPVFLLSAILSGCAAEHEESSSPRTETEPVALRMPQMRQKPRQIRRKRMPFPPEPSRKPQKSLRMCPL